MVADYIGRRAGSQGQAPPPPIICKLLVPPNGPTNSPANSNIENLFFSNDYALLFNGTTMDRASDSTTAPA